MGTLTWGGPESSIPTPLQDLLLCDAIQPGSLPSYQICKLIYETHPIGKKMVDAPIEEAQSQPREITVQNGPEERVRERFLEQWEQDGADAHIASTMRIAKMYGIASVALMAKNVPSDQPIDYGKLSKMDISFNIFDPLNTAGSLVLNQIPTDMDFMKTTDIVVQGQRFHRARTCVILNEDPIYISYTTAAFGFVGRSVYQRALYPLKSFIQTMITDDMVARKAGVLVAKMKPVGSIVDSIQIKLAAIKRQFLKDSKTDSVLSITPEEDIESLNLQNIDAPMTAARMNIIHNIASSVPMPAKLLIEDSFAEGFGEGTEDAKYIARYIDGERRKMRQLYQFFDQIIMYRAWNEDFYKAIRKEFPEYRNVPLNVAFGEWKNSFSAIWPSLLTEPESEKVQVDDVKLRAVLAMMEVLLPTLDPENQARLIEWAADNFNERKLLFTSPLELDFEAIAAHIEEKASREEEMHNSEIEANKPVPTGMKMKARGRSDAAIADYSASVRTLIENINSRRGAAEDRRRTIQLQASRRNGA